MSGIKIGSKNYRPPIYSEMANKSKEDAFLEELERKEKARAVILEKQKVDAEKLIALATAIDALLSLSDAIQMDSHKGNEAKAWVQNALSKASGNTKIMCNKLKGEEA